MFILFTLIDPESGVNKPSIMSIKVVLPDPLGPTNPIVSPWLILIEMFSKVFDDAKG